MSMNVSVGDLKAFAREKVAQGEYDSVSEVVRAGLRLLKRREEMWQARRDCSRPPCPPPAPV